MLKTIMKKIEQRAERDQISKPWVPGNAIMTNCIGCGEKVREGGEESEQGKR